MMKNIAVFCGSSEGNNEIYMQQATELGKAMVRRDLNLVYGGAAIGLMGAVANELLAGGKKVIGIMPNFLAAKEIAHKQLTTFIAVESMHERKQKMCELSDAVIALPGGFGTLDELFEMLCWAQLELHKKPIGLLNTNGYYNDLIRFMRRMVNDGFLKEEYFRLLYISEQPEELLKMLNGEIAAKPLAKKKSLKRWVGISWLSTGFSLLVTLLTKFSGLNLAYQIFFGLTVLGLILALILEILEGKRKKISHY